AGRSGDGLLRLLLGADVQDGPAVRDGLLDELVRAVDVVQRLLQVNDVDAVALGEDVALHLRVPAPGLVTEVDAALEELLHGDDLSHVGTAPFLRPRRVSPRRASVASWSPGLDPPPPGLVAAGPTGASRRDACRHPGEQAGTRFRPLGTHHCGATSATVLRILDAVTWPRIPRAFAAWVGVAGGGFAV